MLRNRNLRGFSIEHSLRSFSWLHRRNLCACDVITCHLIWYLCNEHDERELVNNCVDQSWLPFSRLFTKTNAVWLFSIVIISHLFVVWMKFRRYILLFLIFFPIAIAWNCKVRLHWIFTHWTCSLIQLPIARISCKSSVLHSFLSVFPHFLWCLKTIWYNIFNENCIRLLKCILPENSLIFASYFFSLHCFQ